MVSEFITKHVKRLARRILAKEIGYLEITMELQRHQIRWWMAESVKWEKTSYGDILLADMQRTRPVGISGAPTDIHGGNML